MRILKFARRWATVGAVALFAYLFFFRPRQRRWGATDEEVTSTLPGDELVPHPEVNLTRAITVEASPAGIWPWLVQMGQGRGGYYSYDQLENLMGLKMKNARSVHPEWQHLTVGDIIAAEPGGKGFKVLVIEPERALVIGSVQTDDQGVFEGFKQIFPAFTWAFALEPIDNEHTRLISRLRGTTQPTQSLATKLAGTIFELVEFVMTRKMLLGIKPRAEQAGAVPTNPLSETRTLNNKRDVAGVEM